MKTIKRSAKADRLVISMVIDAITSTQWWRERRISNQAASERFIHNRFTKTV